MVWFISYFFELHYFTVSCFYSVLLEYFMELFYCTSWDWIAWLFFSIITEITIIFNLYCYVVHFKCKASLFISNYWLFDSTNQSLLFRFIKYDSLFNSLNYKFVVHLLHCSVWLINCKSFLLKSFPSLLSIAALVQFRFPFDCFKAGLSTVENIGYCFLVPRLIVLFRFDFNCINI